jgi:hypothetical protein
MHGRRCRRGLTQRLGSETPLRDLAMSDNFIIEISSQTAGIVVRNPDGYRFFSASHRFDALEGQLFQSANEAERAALRIAHGHLKVAA